MTTRKFTITTERGGAIDLKIVGTFQFSPGEFTVDEQRKAVEELASAVMTCVPGTPFLYAPLSTVKVHITK